MNSLKNSFSPIKSYGNVFGSQFTKSVRESLPVSTGETRSSLETPTMNPNDVVIALMGVTGAGKSTFISHFCDQAKIGDGLMSCTNKVESYLCNSLNLPNGRRIWLVDTPGFDDSTRTDTDVLRDIAAFLSDTYREHILLTGIIYLHRISDNRLGGSGLRQMQMFRKLSGEQGMGNIVLATTMWTSVDPSRGQERENELITQDGFWKQLLEQGASIYRQDRGRQSADEILKFLVSRKHRVVFNIQREMVDNNKRLDETAAGREVQAELTKQRKRYEQELKSVKVEMQDALKAKDSQLSKELEAVKAAVERKLEEERESSKRLQASRDDLYRQMEEQREKDREMYQGLVEAERHQRSLERNEFNNKLSKMESKFKALKNSKKPSTNKTPARRDFEMDCCECGRLRDFGSLVPGKWYHFSACSRCWHECPYCCDVKLSISEKYKYYYGYDGESAYW